MALDWFKPGRGGKMRFSRGYKLDEENPDPSIELQRLNYKLNLMMKEIQGPSRFKWMTLGALAGIAMTYFLDPNQGIKRRSDLRMKSELFRSKVAFWFQDQFRKDSAATRRWTEETLPRTDLIENYQPSTTWSGEGEQSF
jgi:hypothetical protein